MAVSLSAQQRYASALRRQRQQHDEAATARLAKEEEDEARRRRLLSVRQQQQGAERSRARQRQQTTQRAAHELDAESRLSEAEAGREAEEQRRQVEDEAVWHRTSLACLLVEMGVADAALETVTSPQPPLRAFA